MATPKGFSRSEQTHLGGLGQALPLLPWLPCEQRVAGLQMNPFHSYHNRGTDSLRRCMGA